MSFKAPKHEDDELDLLRHELVQHDLYDLVVGRAVIGKAGSSSSVPAPQEAKATTHAHTPTQHSATVEDDGANDPKEPTPLRKKTDPAQCRLSGKGMKEATVREASYFWVEAYSEDGERQTDGGDAFFVSVRGPSRVRARVTDNADGTYMIVWKPSTSGIYLSLIHI